MRLRYSRGGRLVVRTRGGDRFVVVKLAGLTGCKAMERNSEVLQT